jgi:hypothetical protein
MDKYELKIYLRDSRPKYDNIITKYTTEVDLSDVNDLIKDMWTKVAMEDIQKDNGKFSFEEVVVGCFRSIAKSLDLQDLVQIRKKTENGKVIDYGK